MFPESDILLEDALNLARRRPMIPMWIKVFIWLFMIMGVISVVGFAIGGIISLLGGALTFNLAMFGLETTSPLSPTGIILFFLFALKGTAAYMLWTEKKNAVNVAIFDAIVGLVVCSVVMFFPELRTGGFSFRGEIILLIPYLIKLVSIRTAWLDGVDEKTFLSLNRVKN